MKVLLVAIATLTSTIAVYSAAHALFIQESPPNGPAINAMVSAAIVSVGILTWTHWRLPNLNTDTLLLLGGIFLVALGSFGAAWNIHLATATGDFEAPVFLTTLLIALQGVLTILLLWRDTPKSGRPEIYPKKR